MFGFHVWDLLIVLLIALLIFGPRKLPEIGGAIGKSIREFQKASREEERSKAPEPVSQPQPPAARSASLELPPAQVSRAANDPDGEIGDQDEAVQQQVV